MTLVKNSSHSTDSPDPVPFYCDPPRGAPPTTWRWLSQWPTFAQIALWLAFFVSGWGFVPNRELVQGVFGGIVVVWMMFDLSLNVNNPRTRDWSRRKRAVWTVLLASLYCLAVVLQLWFSQLFH